MKKYIVLGSEGFIGKEVCGLFAGKNDAALVKIDTAEIPESTAYASYNIDISETDKLISACEKEAPDVIINLAGTFRASRTEELFEKNAFAPLRLLKGLAGKKCRVVLVGSAAEYGNVPGKIKIPETHPLAPVTEYGASKACQSFLVSGITPGSGLSIIIARPFNVIGKTKSERFFWGAFAAQIARIEKGLQGPVIKTGNLKGYRDLVSVKTAAEMLIATAEKGLDGQIYNLCSGTAYRIGDLLKKMIERSKMDIKTEIDPEKQNSADILWSVGDNSKISVITGKKRSAENIEKILDEIVDDFMNG